MRENHEHFNHEHGHHHNHHHCHQAHEHMGHDTIGDLRAERHHGHGHRHHHFHEDLFDQDGQVAHHRHGHGQDGVYDHDGHSHGAHGHSEHNAIASTGSLSDDSVICPCMGTTVGDIRQAVSDGAKTLSDIESVTGAATRCGRCTGEVEACLNDILAAQVAQA